MFLQAYTYEVVCCRRCVRSMVDAYAMVTSRTLYGRRPIMQFFPSMCICPACHPRDVQVCCAGHTLAYFYIFSAGMGPSTVWVICLLSGGRRGLTQQRMSGEGPCVPSQHTLPLSQCLPRCIPDLLKINEAGIMPKLKMH